MPLYRKNVDLYWSQDGDYTFNEGDIGDTRVEQFRGIVQQIMSRIVSARGDWPLQTDIGASMSDFLGRPNSRTTGDEIKRRLLGELVREGMVSASHVAIDVVPIARHSVMIIIKFAPPESTKAFNILFTYNLSENKLTTRNVK